MRWVALVCVLLLIASGIGEHTEHFNIRYSDCYQSDSDTGKVLENAYNYVNMYLGTVPPSIKVIVVNKSRMDAVGKHVEAFSAWSRRSSSIVLRDETLKDPKSLSIVVKHEICHLGLNSIMEFKDDGQFGWMEEGVCMVISGEPLDDLKVSKCIVGKGFLNTSEIAAAVDSNDYQVCKNGYLQSYSLCKYITMKYGVRTLIDIIKNPERDFGGSFRACTSRDFASFYEEWKAYVEGTAAGGLQMDFTDVWRNMILGEVGGGA
ncbi:MAG TPA: hypothetical protein VK436_16740 [Methanocella sp.]|nr:hypothetical protein [Methanocella sp.]